MLILNLQNVTGKKHQLQIPQHVPLHNISPKLTEDWADKKKKKKSCISEKNFKVTPKHST